MIRNSSTNYQKVPNFQRFIEDNGNEGAKDTIVQVIHDGINSAGCVAYLSLCIYLANYCASCSYEKLSRLRNNFNTIIVKVLLQC